MIGENEIIVGYETLILEVKISDKEKKEIHEILEEMEKGEEYRLEDVRAELNV
jgi:hypothetical protein